MSWRGSVHFFPDRINLQYFTHLFYQILIIVRLLGIFVVRIILESWKKNRERALRFVYEDFDSSYEEFLNKAKIPTLHVRRLRTMALETFKILNNMSPPVLSNLIRWRENIVYKFRYNNILQVPRVSTSKFDKKSFSYAAAVLWNIFPNEFRKVSNSINSRLWFKTGMVKTVSVICVDSCSMGLSAALLVTCMCCLTFAIVLLLLFA